MRQQPSRGRQSHSRKASRTGHHPLLLIVLGVCLFALTWVAARAWYAKVELQQAQVLVSSLKSELVSGQYSGTSAKYEQIREHTATARRLTTDPVWAVASHVPYAGRNLAVMHELTVDIDDAMQLAQPVMDFASQLSPQSLSPKNGAVPLQPFVDAGREIATASKGFTALDARISQLSTRGTLPQLQSAHAQLAKIIDSASTMLAQATPILQTLPSVLGADGPRTYVVSFMNNAELRALGGTALSFAQISVDHGAIKLDRSVPAGFDNFTRHTEPIIPVPDGFDDVYPNTLGRFIAEATNRPSFLSESQIVAAEWQFQFGKKIDGVITVDAGALALMVKATGPIPLASGDTLTAQNTAKLLLNEVYTRYNSGNEHLDQINQGKVYADAVDSTFNRLASGKFDPAALFASARTAAAEHRLAMWFADPAEQSVFAQTSFGAHDLLQSTATTDAVGVYLSDQVGSKLDYSLGTKLTTGSAVCSADGKQVHRLTLALTNGVTPAQAPTLSPSIQGTHYAGYGLQKGEQRVWVWFYLPPGSTILDASVDGKPVEISHVHDTDHPVQETRVTAMPGATTQMTIDVKMAEPGKRKLVTEVTPTVQGTKLATAPLDCSMVPAG